MKYKNITYCNYPRSYGYHVRIMFQGHIYRRFFSFGRYGQGSLSKAVAWRNAIESSVGRIRSERFIVGESLKRELPMGICIGKKWKDSFKTKKSKHYVVTVNPEPNKLWRTSVSIDKHGEKKALSMAVAIRKAKVKEFYGE